MDDGWNNENDKEWMTYCDNDIYEVIIMTAIMIIMTGMIIAVTRTTLLTIMMM